MLRAVVSALVCVSIVRTQDFYSNNLPVRQRYDTSQRGEQHRHNSDERPWRQGADPEERERVGRGQWENRDESSREELENEYWDEDSVSNTSNSNGQAARVSELETATLSTAETTRPSTAKTTRPSTVATMRTTTAMKKCPEFFSHRFGNSCYRGFRGHAMWPNAEACCIRYGGHLASIHSAAENSFLRDYAAAHNVLPAWIGALVTRSEMDEWSDRSPKDYTNWAPGQPSNSFDSAWSGVITADGSWKVLDGTITQDEIQGFFCKWAGTL